MILKKFFSETKFNVMIGDETSLPPDTDFVERTECYAFFSKKEKRNSVLIPPLHASKFYQFKTISKIFKFLHFENFSNLKKLLKPRSKVIPSKHGCAWWTMSSDSAKLVMNWISENPTFMSFHLHTFIPDEIFFQSIISHLKISNVLWRSLTYVRWSSGTPHLFNSSNLEELKKANKEYLFARKFDVNQNSEILLSIDEIINDQQ